MTTASLLALLMSLLGLGPVEGPPLGHPVGAGSPASTARESDGSDPECLLLDDHHRRISNGF